jgi:hypothetical protein
MPPAQTRFAARGLKQRLYLIREDSFSSHPCAKVWIIDPTAAQRPHAV